VAANDLYDGLAQVSDVFVGTTIKALEELHMLHTYLLIASIVVFVAVVVGMLVPFRKKLLHESKKLAGLLSQLPQVSFCTEVQVNLTAAIIRGRRGSTSFHILQSFACSTWSALQRACTSEEDCQHVHTLATECDEASTGPQHNHTTLIEQHTEPCMFLCMQESDVEGHVKQLVIDAATGHKPTEATKQNWSLARGVTAAATAAARAAASRAAGAVGNMKARMAEASAANAAAAAAAQSGGWQQYQD
jgi:hypothetical protein